MAYVAATAALFAAGAYLGRNLTYGAGFAAFIGAFACLIGMRRSSDIASAPFLAASIFLDVLNVFLLFLRIFSGSGRD